MPSLRDPIQRLCSMKNQVNFTPHQLETWVAVLSCYDVRIVSRVCLEIGLSDDPFPDCGKIALRCERLRREAAGHVASNDKQSIGTAQLKRIAEALNLRV